MTTDTPIPANDPLMLAWTAHKATDEYANSRQWAAHPEHLEGSLWALFMAGWKAALAAAPTPQAGEPRALVQEWASTNHVRFVNRSSGLYSTDTVGLESLCALVEMARATPPEQEADARDTSAAFDAWWDAGNLMKANPYNEGTPAFWAWEGWWAAKGEQK